MSTSLGYRARGRRFCDLLRKALANSTALSHDQLDELHELKLLVTKTKR